METATDPRADGSAPNYRVSLVWLFALLGLLVWQGWMTFCLFHTENGWTDIVDDRPIISGFHAQHLYLGTLGAQSLYSEGRSCCLDPCFQAGYPKTPVFNGSRLAEFFLILGGGTYQPAAYKVGLALMCLLVPGFLILACRGAGMGLPAGVLATVFGTMLWWSPPGREALQAGETELLLASLALLAHVGLMIRFDRQPGLASWLGLFLTSSFCWFFQPLLFPIAFPLLLVYYLTVGTRHRGLVWHLSLLLAELAALAVNLFWLLDWVSFWWLRMPPPLPPRVPRTIRGFWNAPLWGDLEDRVFSLFLLTAGTIGVILWNQTRQRATARLFWVGASGLLTLAFLGIAWEPLGQMGTNGLLVPSLIFFSLPAAHALEQIFQFIARLLGGNLRTALLAGGLTAGLAYAFPEPFVDLSTRALATEPLDIGLGQEREDLVEALTLHTGPEARILWEDFSLSRTESRWTALLPILTGRYFIGGLDPDRFIEHSSIGLIDQFLTGKIPEKHINRWTDQDLEFYCRNYNVGWVVARSRAVIQRLEKWKSAEKTLALPGEQAGYLFTLKNSAKNYILKGKAQLVHADFHHLTLADVVPENGVVVLSLHYQAGLQATPTRAQVEPEPSILDPIGFVRLRVSGPVARLTLTWEGK